MLQVLSEHEARRIASNIAKLTRCDVPIGLPPPDEHITLASRAKEALEPGDARGGGQGVRLKR
jgi:hypothetical protein